MNIIRFLRNFRVLPYGLPLIWLGTLVAGQSARADSMTLSETWSDTSVSQATDNGTFSASLTVPGLQNFTSNMWANTSVLLSTPNFVPQVFGDTMGDASTNSPNPNGYGPGSLCTATTATFYITTPDTNGNLVNGFKLTFSRSGNTLSILGQTVTKPTLQPPWSIAALNYLYDPLDPTAFTPHTVNDPNPVQVQVESANGTVTNANFIKTMLITETDTTNSDAFGDILNHVTLSGTTDFTPPTLTDVSPVGNLTVTNGLLPVTVKATTPVSFTNASIANVEFYFNGQDFGPGANNISNLWSQNLALLPGVNTIQTVATDSQGNVSATNTLTVTYANGQTNANLITFSEHWVDFASDIQTSTGGFIGQSTQDAGAINAAIQVSALTTMSAETWSNLILTVNFGYYSLSNSLTAANILTPTTATFSFSTTNDIFGNFVTLRRLTITRVGGKLLLTADTVNPTYIGVSPLVSQFTGLPFLAALYYGTAGAVSDQQQFSISLADGSTSASYLDLTRTIYLSGTNVITTTNTIVLDNIQISGAADFTPPALTNSFPATTTLSTTNGLFNVQVRATDNEDLTNVEFYVNGQDFGTGANGASNIWFQNLALIPGTNMIQAVAADSAGNQSVENFTVNYVNTQTNANEIVFYEHWQDGYVTNSGGAYSFSQDAGVVDAAFTIPALQTVTADTWSNLVLSLAFGQTPPATGLPGGGFPVLPYFGSLSLDYVSLSTANILTTTTATFQSFVTNALDNPVLVEQVTIKRVGTNLLLAAELLNPTYNNPPQNFFSALYYGAAGTINDQQPFILSLTDGNNSTQYANVDRPVYIRGTNSITTTNSISLNNIQINGVADFVPPALTNIFPATTTFTTTNGLLTVQVGVADNIAVSNVEFYVDGQDFGPGENVSNSWSQNLALSPGTNIIGTIAVDSSGNASISNVVKVNYINAYTNANLITFSEHLEEYQPIFIFSPGGGYENLYQDAAILNAALSVPLVKNITADTWSNLNLSISFDGLQFNSNLSSATLLTTNSATFDAIANNVEQLVVTRIGGTLLVVAKTSNPNYSFTDVPFVADNYEGIGGNIDDQKSFSLTLADGITSEQYADISRIVYIAGSNSLTASLPISTLSTNFLDNIQITGAADFVPPINQITAPIAGQQWSNNTFVITGKAQDDRAVSNVVYSVNGSDWAPANTGNGFTNWTASVNLIPGTNRITAYACDYDGNFSTTNTSASVTFPAARCRFNWPDSVRFRRITATRFWPSVRIILSTPPTRPALSSPTGSSPLMAAPAVRPSPPPRCRSPWPQIWTFR